MGDYRLLCIVMILHYFKPIENLREVYYKYGVHIINRSFTGTNKKVFWAAILSMNSSSIYGYLYFIIYTAENAF